MSKDPEIKYDRIRTNATEIWMDKTDVLCVRIFDGAEMDEPAFKACFEVYRKLGCQKSKTLQLIDARAVFNITREGKLYSAQQSPNYFLATALITENLSVRLLVNFFNKYHKHAVPFKLFRNEPDAYRWLNTFRS